MRYTITSSSDLTHYLANVRPDVTEIDGGEVLARRALIRANHPEYGTDWTEWLSSEETQALITSAAEQA